MSPAPGRGGRRAAVLLLAAPLVLATLAPGAAARGLLGGDGGLVSLDGDDAIVSVGGEGLLGGDGLLGSDAGLLSASASASASPDTVPPGELVVVTLRLESADLLEISLDEQITCTVTLPDGRTEPVCDPRTSELDVDLLGSGDDTLRLGLIAPDLAGTYTVTFETTTGLNVGGGSPTASAQFTVDPGTATTAQGTDDAGSEETFAQHEAGASPGGGAPGQAAGDGDDLGAWLLAHPWVLVAIAAVVSVTAFTVAARAAPGR